MTKAEMYRTRQMNRGECIPGCIRAAKVVVFDDDSVCVLGDDDRSIVATLFDGLGIMGVDVNNNNDNANYEMLIDGSEPAEA